MRKQQFLKILKIILNFQNNSLNTLHQSKNCIVDNFITLFNGLKTPCSEQEYCHIAARL